MSPGSVVTRLVILLAVLGVVAVPALAAESGDSLQSDALQQSPLQQESPQQVSTDEIRTETDILIELQDDGDARWTVSATLNLTTPNETAAYRDLAESFQENESDTLGLQAFRRARAQASAATGRSMSITDVTRTTAADRLVENGTGRLTLGFTWTNFGRVESDRLTIGDAFQTPEGRWFPGLEADQTLTIRPPPGFGVVNASVAPEDGELRWEGPQAFEEATLAATFTGSGSDGATVTPRTMTPTPTPGPGPDNDSGSMLWILLGIFGVAILALVGYFLSQRDDDWLLSPAEQEADETDEQPMASPPVEGSDEDDTDEGDDDVDVELLSDEERVERLLEENGGRMKQANIVKETGWSNAKVSQLLSSMEDEGRIDKLRIGRENLISFPDEDITDITD